MPFNGLGLSDSLLKTRRAWFRKADPCSGKVDPADTQGERHNCFGSDRYRKDSGLRAPTLDRLESGKRIQCLILEPTRELAQQVEEALKSYSKYLDTRIGVVYGALSMAGNAICWKRRRYSGGHTGTLA